MTKQLWFVFYLDGKELAAVTSKGSTVDELNETLHLLAYERGVHPNAIEVKEEYR